MKNQENQKSVRIGSLLLGVCLPGDWGGLVVCGRVVATRGLISSWKADMVVGMVVTLHLTMFLNHLV